MRSCCLPVVLLALLASCGSPGPPAQNAGGSQVGQPLVVYLVRHAEKLDDGPDPMLTEAGSRRAEELVRVLVGRGVDHIHSTDYNRTRSTAAPLARREKQGVELYDPRNLDELVSRLLAAGGCHLVVGHSNTTVRLVELLGGDPGDEIDEAVEYDRLYTVVIDGDGSVRSELERYGER